MKDAEDEAFDELSRKQGMWGGGFQAKRAMAAAKLQDGKCELCVDGCIACDARAQPAQEREWVGLTDEDIDKTYQTMPRINKPQPTPLDFARAVEQLLKERNA